MPESEFEECALGIDSGGIHMVTTETEKASSFWNKRTKGRLCVLFGSVWISPDALLVKLVSSDNVWTTIFYRYLFVLLTFGLGFSCFYGRSLAGELLKFREVWKWTLLSITAGVLANIFFVVSLAHETAAYVLMIYSFNTLVVGFASYFLFHDPLSLKQSVCLLFGLGGILTAVIGNFLQSSDNNDWYYSLYPLGLCFTMATWWLTIRRISSLSDANVTLINLFSFSFTTMICSGFVQTFRLSPYDFLYLLIQGVFVMPVALFAWVYGGKYTHPAEVSLIALLEVICGPLLVWIFLEELPSKYVFIGGPILLFSVAGFLKLASEKEETSV